MLISTNLQKEEQCATNTDAFDKKVDSFHYETPCKHAQDINWKIFRG